jgi:hypothetical protein
MKVTKELAKVFIDACNHVDTWEGWQRSLDPQGSQIRVEATHSADEENKEQVSDQRKLKRSA